MTAFTPFDEYVGRDKLAGDMAAKRIREKDPRGGLRLLDERIHGDPDYVTSSYVLVEAGNCHLAVNEFEDAARYFRQVLEAHPQDKHALAGLARTALFSRNFEEAEKVYSEALAEYPTDAVLIQGWANTALRKGDYSLALSRFLDGLELEPHNFHLIQGYREATHKVEEELSLESRLASRQMAELRANNKADEAVALGEEWMNAHCGSRHIYRELVESYIALGQFEKARETLDDAMDVFDATYTVCEMHARSAYLCGDYVEADKRYKELAANFVGCQASTQTRVINDAKNAEAVLAGILKRACEGKGRLEDAIAQGEQWMEKTPSLLALCALGKCYVAHHDYDKADALYEKYMDRFGYSPRVRFGYGDVAFARQDYDTATERFETMVKLFPTDSQGYEKLALALTKQYELATAKEVLLTGISKLGRPDAYLLGQLGSVSYLLALGDGAGVKRASYRDSEMHCRASIQEMPHNNIEAYSTLGQIACRTHDKVLAQEAYTGLSRCEALPEPAKKLCEKLQGLNNGASLSV